MVAAFPLAKIGLLLMKQLSKPLANIIKNEAKKHPLIRKYVIIPTGRVYGWVENKTLVKMKGVPSREVPKLTEEDTIELGSNAIGEIILFGMLTIILLAEYNRQGDKKAVIQKTKEEELTNLIDTVLNLLSEVEDIKSDLKKMRADIEVAEDVLDLEEQRHTVVQDDDFLDVITSNKKNKFWRKSKLGRPSDPSLDS